MEQESNLEMESILEIRVGRGVNTICQYVTARYVVDKINF